MNDSSGAFANNIMWKMIDLISRKVFGFAISILLARLLMPEDFGIIALTIVFIAFTNVFILNGFNVALIRKEEVKTIDYSTVMTMSLCFVTIVNLVIFFSAPAIADFYETKALNLVLKAMVFGLYFSAVSAVVSAKATRELKFKQMAIPSFCSNAIGGIIAVIMAYMGCGVWALVAQHVVASFVLMVWYIILFKFPLSLNFSLNVVKELYKFTLGVIGTSFLEFLGNHVCSLVVGKTYNSKGLGHYDRSITFPEMISANLSGAISSVLLPTLSKHQNDIEGVKVRTRKTISFTMFVILPIMFILIGSSNVLIPVILTDRWTPIIPLFCVSCILYAIAPIRTIEYSVLYSLGRSKHSVKTEAIRAVLMIIGVLTVALVVKAPLFWVVFTNMMVCLAVNLYIHHFIKGILNYSFLDLLGDFLSSLVISLIVMVLLLIIGWSFKASLMLLIFQIAVGTMSYGAISYFFNNNNIQFLKGLFLPYILKYKNR